MNEEIKNIQNEIAELKNKIVSLKADIITGKSKDTSALRKTRVQIARLSTKLTAVQNGHESK
jgi:ribosomal protein L29